MTNALLSRCGRAISRQDIIVLVRFSHPPKMGCRTHFSSHLAHIASRVIQGQYILAADVAIAITPPQHNPQRTQKFVLASVVVTLVAILTAMVSSSADANQLDLAADRKLDDGIKLFALAMTLVALVLFVIAIAMIQPA